MQLTRTLFLCCQLVPMTKLSIIVYAFPLYTDISLTSACHTVHLNFKLWLRKQCFLYLDFSLVNWKLDRSLGSGEIPAVYLLQLMEETGLSGYMQEPACNRTTGVYTGDVNGWTKGNKHQGALHHVMK